MNTRALAGLCRMGSHTRNGNELLLESSRLCREVQRRPKADAKRELRSRRDRYSQGNRAQRRVRLGIAQTMDKQYPLRSQ